MAPPREEELKFSVDPAFTLPDLDGCAPEGGEVRALGRRRLRATYYDTPDLRLARMGITLRRRTGEDGPPWHLKLPTGTVGVRYELTAPGGPKAVPEALASLVTAWVRHATLGPVATLRTDRDAWLITDAGGEPLAEVVDDAVAILDGKAVRSRFREIEVERGSGDAAPVLSAVAGRLVAAGAVSGEFTPKVMRALGSGSAAPPDVPVPDALPEHPTAGAAVGHALRRTVRLLLGWDAPVRRGEDDAVHQMRVCCRRLRSDLRTFAPLLDAEWAGRLTGELRWLASALGGPRDAEVLRERLHRTAAADPLSSVDPGAVDRIDAELAAREAVTLAALAEVLDSDRYVTLLDSLVDAVRSPRLTALAAEPAEQVLPDAVARAWRKLHRDAARLRLDQPDHVWHLARIRAKRARYAAEAVSGVLGKDAARLARACARVQEVLGEHQDAAHAADVWLDVARAHEQDPVLVLTCGRLAERERAAVLRARGAFAEVWGRASRPKVTQWLPR